MCVVNVRTKFRTKEDWRRSYEPVFILRNPGTITTNIGPRPTTKTEALLHEGKTDRETTGTSTTAANTVAHHGEI